MLDVQISQYWYSFLSAWHDKMPEDPELSHEKENTAFTEHKVLIQSLFKKFHSSASFHTGTSKSESGIWLVES